MAVIDNLFADCGDLGCNDYLQTRLDERIAAQIARHEAVMVLISAEK